MSKEEKLTDEEKTLREWLVWYAKTRPTLPRGVPSWQVDGAPGDEYAEMPGFARLAAVRRGGAWVGWVMVRHIPGLGQCSSREGALPPATIIPGCDDGNCPLCPDKVADARARGFVFIEGGWS